MVVLPLLYGQSFHKMNWNLLFDGGYVWKAMCGPGFGEEPPEAR